MTETNLTERPEDTIRRFAGALCRVADIHKPLHIYGECGHSHTDEDVHNGTATDTGDFLTCQDGYQCTVCRQCCTDAIGGQNEECVTEHNHAPGEPICVTAEAISFDVPAASSAPGAQETLDAARALAASWRAIAAEEYDEAIPSDKPFAHAHRHRAWQLEQLLDGKPHHPTYSDGSGGCECGSAVSVSREDLLRLAETWEAAAAKADKLADEREAPAAIMLSTRAQAHADCASELRDTVARLSAAAGMGESGA